MINMNGKAKKITAIIIIIVFAFAFIFPLIANMLVRAEQLNDIGQKKQQTQSEINKIKKTNKDILREKKKADEKIKTLEQGVFALQKEINQYDERLAVLEGELEQAQTDAEKQYCALKKRIRVMYEQGADSYLDVLLSSGSLTDFLNRFEIIKQITEYDNKRFKKLIEAINQIEIKTEETEQIKAQKADKMSVLQKEKDYLGAEQKNRDQLVNENNMEIAQLEKFLNELDAIEARLKAEAAAKMNKNTKYAGGQLEWPAPGYYTITSPFGSRYHPVLKINRMHNGLDIAAPNGASVVAANDGTVIRATYNSSYGNYIIIDHGGGIATLYAHSSKLCVSQGTKVKRGQEIMKVGSTGVSTGPHLHYEVISNGSNVNPASYY
ncbi:MAG: peptidoglycan DD-metalloendopeptidase family protein [Clostridiaceae bacterium]|nr:peptidoglycan DD-metalloendopeptidase family protein [Clostridiaceae bacterium]